MRKKKIVSSNKVRSGKLSVIASIDIDPKDKGKFTAYCKRNGFDGVTCECIMKGLKSPDVGTRRRANFAYNFGFKKNGKKCSDVEKFRNKNKSSLIDDRLRTVERKRQLKKSKIKASSNYSPILKDTIDTIKQAVEDYKWEVEHIDDDTNIYDIETQTLLEEIKNDKKIILMIEKCLKSLKYDS